MPIIYGFATGDGPCCNECLHGEAHVCVEVIEAVMTLDQLIESPELRLKVGKVPLRFLNPRAMVQNIHGEPR